MTEPGPQGRWRLPRVTQRKLMDFECRLRASPLTNPIGLSIAVLWPKGGSTRKSEAGVHRRLLRVLISDERGICIYQRPRQVAPLISFCGASRRRPER